MSSMTKYTFDHDALSIWEAVGLTEDRWNELERKAKDISEMSDYMSEDIEKAIGYTNNPIELVVLGMMLARWG